MNKNKRELFEDIRFLLITWTIALLLGIAFGMGLR